MPTPATAFADVAAEYGNVDPDDLGAVQRWFTEELPKLPRESIEAIFRELLAQDGAPASRVLEPSYPAGVSLPSLRDSPLIRRPSFVGAWAQVLRRALSRRR